MPPPTSYSRSGDPGGRRVRCVPVVESGDRLIGVIAQADLATKVGHDDPKLIEELLERISTASRPV